MAPQDPIAFDWRRARLDHRDCLPHVRQENVIYFITFRLGDSLPAEKIAELKQEHDAWLRLNPLPHGPGQTREYQRIWTVRIERLLDAGYGSCIFSDPECRQMLEATLRHDDEVKYRLGAYVIMPNHVHALVQMRPRHELGDSIKAWKSISARRIGKHLGRTGSYWMDEYFDHAVRHEQSLQQFARYIRKNPEHLPLRTFTLGCGTLAHNGAAGALTGGI